jgi:hypothetical protein
MRPSRSREQIPRLVGAVAVLLFAVSPSCGGSRTRAPGPEPQSKPPGRVDPIYAGAVRGSWAWSHVGESPGVRKVELENWSFQIEGARVTGEYEREVTFLSLDGAAFECNQALSYTLITRYRFRGVAHRRHLELVETDYETEPSPCEGGYRKLGRYEGFLRSGELLLIWKGGSQTLTKQSDTGVAAAHTAGQRDHHVTGRWVWHNAARPNSEGEVRVEREDWELAEEDGQIVGSYLRKVTIYDRQGRPYDCSGTSHYSYSDRYTVRGVRGHQGRIVLTEVDADAEKHPCLAKDERHLDQAIAQMRGDYLELEWRGGHRQVLHRPIGERP